MKSKRASILISALWIIAILSVFAVSVGRQSAVSLKVTSYNIDKLKACFIARAAIMRGLLEKALEYKTGRSTTIDALSQKWANNEEIFFEHEFGDGVYTLGYQYLAEEETTEEMPMLYGLMDEQSKININYAPKETMANLLLLSDVEADTAYSIAAAVVDWRDGDDEVTSSEDGSFYGAEDLYYEGLSPAYDCKNATFDTIYELTLIRDLTPDILAKIENYITVYGDGKVNINTASEVVLDAIFGEDFENLASKVTRYRRGSDEIIGTEDDRWFCLGQYVIERGEEGLVEIKNLQEAEWYANIYGIIIEEYNRIKGLITGSDSQLCVSSRTYRAIATGQVRRVKAHIEGVYVFEGEGNAPVIKFWYQE